MNECSREGLNITWLSRSQTCRSIGMQEADMCACARVGVCAIVVQRKHNNHNKGGGGHSKLTSFTLEGKEQTNNETGKGEHRSSLVQEVN